eukprot:scaffold70094_cov32-Tisochrysis_lutea.AAC.1
MTRAAVATPLFSSFAVDAVCNGPHAEPRASERAAFRMNPEICDMRDIGGLRSPSLGISGSTTRVKAMPTLEMAIATRALSMKPRTSGNTICVTRGCIIALP